MRRSICVMGCLLFLFGVTATAQTTSGQISGTVVDPQAAMVPGAKVVLENEGTGSTRTATTGSNGTFVFPALTPGGYQIRVEAAGFKSLQRTGILLTANEERSLGSLALEVGGVSETVTVAAEAVQVQMASGESSSLISSNQIQNLQSRGRDPITLMRVLPGVNGAADNDAAGGSFGSFTPTVNGLRSNLNNVTIDGQNRTNTDVTQADDALLSMDAIQEVKVLTNGYQAEYGRNAGAAVNIVTKGGSREFHGTGYYFGRNDALNANSFFRNQVAATASKPPLYRYNTFGGTLGGPVYIPGKFNTKRNKLFFFYNLEKFVITTPGGLLQSQLPTAVERTGNFSQFGQAGSTVVRPRDPITGQFFPNNQIPAAGTPGCGVSFSCLNPIGQAILNYFPLPLAAGQLDPAVTKNGYNYQFQDIQQDPKLQQGLRFDINPTDKDNLTSTLRRSTMDQRGWNGIIGGPAGANFQNFFGHYKFGEQASVFSYRRVISPTILNEVAAGYAATSETGVQLTPTSWDHIIRSKVGLGSLGQLFPSNNPNDLIPNFHFNLPNSQTGPNFGLDVNNRFPIVGYDVDIHVLDNLSYTHGAHQFKAGFYYENDTSYRGKQGQSRGDLTWSADASDTGQTGNPFADALIGHFNQYIEATNLATAKNKAHLVEWFGQDSWKATPRLTIEMGLRMGTASPWVFIHGDAAGFIPSLYNAANAPQLIVPRCAGDTLATVPHNCGSTANRIGMNPVTGQILPNTLIGTYAPNTGNVANGMVTAANTAYDGGFTTGSGLQWAPRFGFAWDVFGNGKTAFRANGAIMKNMISSNGTFVNGGKVNPPIVFNPTLRYGNISSYLAASSGVLSPVTAAGWTGDFKVPTVYQYGMSLQHELARNTIVDIAYVGNTARNLSQTQDLNTLPYGKRFLASSADPTSSSSAPLPDAFLRGMPGYNSVNYTSWNGISNYNGLQVQLNRRFSSHVEFGAAYTWSKTMDDGNNRPIYLNQSARNYSLSTSDQTHVLNFNYTYYLPKLSNINSVARAAFGGWQFSGITSFASGTPQTITFSTLGGVDWNGGGDGQRPNLLGPIGLAKGDRTFSKYFATQNVQLPAKGDPGGAGRVMYRGPGVNNWDLNLAKTFFLGSEKRKLLFRWEAYNAFNHTQFSTVNNSATFNTATGTQTNAQFGQLTASRPNRIMQGSLRFSF